MRAVSLFVAAVASMAPWPLARAHVAQLPNGLDWHERGGVAVTETTVGYLVSEEPGHPAASWGWVCHEAVSSSGLLPRYRATSAGVLALVRTLGEESWLPGESVYLSPDGCTWAPAEGLSGQLVADIAVVDGEVLVVTSNLEAANALWRSDDGGATFEQAALAGEDRLLHSVARLDGGGLAVGATRVTPFAAALLVGDLDAESWTERPLPAGSEPEAPSLLGDQAGELWVRMDGLQGDRLLWSGDGDAWTEVFTTEADILDGTALGDGRLLVTTDDGALRLIEGDAVAELTEREWVRATTPTRDGLVFVEDTIQGAPLLSVGDLDARVATLSFDELTGPLACPDGTRTRQACDAGWETVARSVGIWEGEPIGEPVLPPQERRGCRAPSVGLAWLLPLVGLPGLRRRRRRG